MNRMEATVEILLALIDKGHLADDLKFDSRDEKLDFILNKIDKAVDSLSTTLKKCEK